MGSRFAKSFLIEAACWLAVVLTVMFLAEPIRTTNSLERPDKYPIPLGIALAFGLAAAYLRSVLVGSRRTLKARTLVLEDETGRSRLLLDAGGKYPTLQFWTSNGLPQVVISGDEQQPGLSIFGGPDLKSSAEFTVSGDASALSLDCGQGEIKLQVDANAKSLASLDLDKTGTNLFFSNSEGFPRIMLSVQPDGESLMMLEGNGSCTLCVNEGGPQISMRDAEGNVVHH